MQCLPKVFSTTGTFSHFVTLQPQRLESFYLTYQYRAVHVLVKWQESDACMVFHIFLFTNKTTKYVMCIFTQTFRVSCRFHCDYSWTFVRVCHRYLLCTSRQRHIWSFFFFSDCVDIICEQCGNMSGNRSGL